VMTATLSCSFIAPTPHADDDHRPLNEATYLRK
jgi:hypothetical protein